MGTGSPLMIGAHGLDLDPLRTSLASSDVLRESSGPGGLGGMGGPRDSIAALHLRDSTASFAGAGVGSLPPPPHTPASPSHSLAANYFPRQPVAGSASGAGAGAGSGASGGPGAGNLSSASSSRLGAGAGILSISSPAVPSSATTGVGLGSGMGLGQGESGGLGGQGPFGSAGAGLFGTGDGYEAAAVAAGIGRVPAGARVILPRFPDPEARCRWDDVDSPDFWRDLQRVKARVSQFASRIKNDFGAFATAGASHPHASSSSSSSSSSSASASAAAASAAALGITSLSSSSGVPAAPAAFLALQPHQIQHFRDSLITVSPAHPAAVAAAAAAASAASAAGAGTGAGVTGAGAGAGAAATAGASAAVVPVDPIPDETARLLTQLAELQRRHSADQEAALALEQHWLLHAREAVDRQSDYDSAKIKHVEKVRSYLAIKAADARKLKEKEDKVAMVAHQLEVRRLELFGSLSDAHAGSALALLEPAVMRLQALRQFFAAGHELMSGFAPTLDAMNRRVSSEAQAAADRFAELNGLRTRLMAAAPDAFLSAVFSGLDSGGGPAVPGGAGHVGGMAPMALSSPVAAALSRSVAQTRAFAFGAAGAGGNPLGSPSATPLHATSGGGAGGGGAGGGGEAHTPGGSAAGAVGADTPSASALTGIRDLDQRRVNKALGSEKRGHLYLPPPLSVRVWCELKGGVFTVADARGGAPTVMPAMLCTVKQPRDSKVRGCFSVISPQATITLQAETDRELRDWLDVFQNAISAALNSGKTASSSSSSSAFSSSSSGAGGASAAAGGAAAAAGGAAAGGGGELSHVALQRRLYAVEGNRACADCGAADPDWLSLNLGVLLCLECVGVHRLMGTDVSKARSLTMDALDDSQAAYMAAVGNRRANDVWEAALQQDPALLQRTKPHADSATRAQREAFIRAKYEARRFLRVDSAQVPADPVGRADALTRLLFVAIQTSSVPELYRALAWGADPLSRLSDNEGRTSLHEVVMYSQLACCLCVMHWCRDFSHVEDRGWTCLHYAAYSNDPALVDLCLSFGGQQLALVADKDGRTPEQVARECNTGPEYAQTLPIVLESLRNAANKAKARAAAAASGQ